MFSVTMVEPVIRRIENHWMGILFPALVFVISFIAAWLLYWHFAKQVQRKS
jgi:peptidoglycan/LPS O-acetylase OafA/YrhL